jgi:MoaA/NifB/PqqE/SkfB family radical SAM enzyme
MCDIWKDNKNLKQLTESDIEGLLTSFKKFGTQEVLMSGGEALLNPNFFRFCEILKREHIKITLLSTGLSVKKNADQLIELVDSIIVSIDGDEETHDQIRNIPGAFNKLREGVEQIKSLNRNYPITARTVIHELNFRKWPALIESAVSMGLNQISFLPADVRSTAFNRGITWAVLKQQEILINESALPELQETINSLINDYKFYFDNRFIAESPEKIQKIYAYYAAFYGLNPFPYKKCNAPWVSTVIEADGTVRPCFFHERMGNIRENSLEEIMNSEKNILFRKNLDMDSDPTCVKCVCYLNLPPRVNLKNI